MLMVFWKTKCVLGQCTICASTNDWLVNCQMSTLERAQLKKQKIEHLSLGAKGPSTTYS